MIGRTSVDYYIIILQKLTILSHSQNRALFLILAAAAAAKSFQSCPTLCDPIDSSPLGCPVPEILQARTLEWVAISFSLSLFFFFSFISWRLITL